MDLSSLSDLLNAALASKSGMAVAALALALILWGLQKVPAVKAFVAKSPVLAHVAMLVVAVIPAVLVKLTSGATWLDVLATAVMTFLAAVGVQGVGAVLTGSSTTAPPAAS